MTGSSCWTYIVEFRVTSRHAWTIVVLRVLLLCIVHTPSLIRFDARRTIFYSIVDQKSGLHRHWIKTIAPSKCVSLKIYFEMYLFPVTSDGTSHEFSEPSELEVFENVNERVRAELCCQK